ncbi:hypothetical protein AHiyo8_pI68380 (plasmid) [Arthrobacter sp. Hiyo8]|nr:hypothetical protein AHiyo8_pI68380 [Arthrobacter sp. Hiyo8]GAP60733.1 hypothetical protein AHiyo1_43150 [Arthrobacter sp. Hiyo1]
MDLRGDVDAIQVPRTGPRCDQHRVSTQTPAIAKLDRVRAEVNGNGFARRHRHPFDRREGYLLSREQSRKQRLVQQRAVDRTARLGVDHFDPACESARAQFLGASAPDEDAWLRLPLHYTTSFNEYQNTPTGYLLTRRYPLLIRIRGCTDYFRQ